VRTIKKEGGGRSIRFPMSFALIARRKKKGTWGGRGNDLLAITFRTRKKRGGVSSSIWSHFAINHSHQKNKEEKGAARRRTTPKGGRRERSFWGFAAKREKEPTHLQRFLPNGIKGKKKNPDIGTRKKKGKKERKRKRVVPVTLKKRRRHIVVL